MASIEDGDETYKDLVKDCHFNTSFAAAHGLQGTFYVEEHKPQITIEYIGTLFNNLIDIISN